MWKHLWAILSNEFGQEPSEPDVPEDNVDPGEVVIDDEMEGLRVPYDAEAPSSEPDTTPETPDQVPTEESFVDPELNLDPNTFSPENKEIFKKMQSAYTKRMQAVRGDEQRYSNMERFYNDPQFAHEILSRYVQQNGYTLTPNNQQAVVQQQQTPTNIEQGAKLMADVIKGELPENLHWFANPAGTAMWKVMSQILAPVLQQQEKFSKQQVDDYNSSLEKEYTLREEEFARKNPGWEQHEGQMTKILRFFNDSTRFYDPELGSKHELLYKLATGNVSAVKEATDRVVRAQRNKTHSSAPGRSVAQTRQSAEDEVAKIEDNNQAWAKAVSSALATARRRR